MKGENKKEQLARDICNKPATVVLGECHQTYGRRNPLCMRDKKCRIDEKSEEQVNYVLSHNQDNIILRACPGSGKTEVVGLKSAFEIKKWDRKNGGIAVLTFTNNAADEIIERVNQFVGTERIGHPHFVGTIDGWLHGYMAHPFAHLKTGFIGKNGDRSIRIIESSSKSSFLSAFRTRYSFNGTGNPSANEYFFDKEINKWVFASGNKPVDQKRNSVTLSDWQCKDLQEAKNKFERNGFATYRDIENICFDLVHNIPELPAMIAKRFPLIIVDECQDLSWIQIQILNRFQKNGSYIHLVGDVNQAIYEFRKVDPAKVIEYSKIQSFSEMSLTKNFRSCQTIVNLCRQLVNDGTPIESANTKELEKACILIKYPKDKIANIPNWFLDYLSQAGTDEIQLKKDLSAVVTRSWSNVARMRPSGSDKIKTAQYRLAMAIYLWRTKCFQSIENALDYIGHFFIEKYFEKTPYNAKQSYCPESVDSPMRWRLFLAAVLNGCGANTSIGNLSNKWKDWVIGVREHFGSIARESSNELLSCIKNAGKVRFCDLNGNNFKVPNGEGEKLVMDFLENLDAKSSLIRITTIHSVKGETLDAVLMVSSPDKKSKDGHWTQWLEDPKSEAARLAFVASSRPKHLLVWAIPTVSNEDITKLNDLIAMGFHPIEFR